MLVVPCRVGGPHEGEEEEALDEQEVAQVLADRPADQAGSGVVEGARAGGALYGADAVALAAYLEGHDAECGVDVVAEWDGAVVLPVDDAPGQDVRQAVEGILALAEKYAEAARDLVQTKKESASPSSSASPSKTSSVRRDRPFTPARWNYRSPAHCG
ncbi:hypothetical protein [Streptomyces tubercidicus]|uniref:hypothetical protein n=1 Tax=Streptomyces tubercidicus TaxID=47759 RepID=UPI003990D2A0